MVVVQGRAYLRIAIAQEGLDREISNNESLRA